MIHSNVRTMMEQRGVSIRNLMRATGLSSLTIERARGPLVSRCTLTTLQRIAVALECPLTDLFTERRVEGEAVHPRQAVPAVGKQK